jgi:HEXXH motif-containing protein
MVGLLRGAHTRRPEEVERIVRQPSIATRALLQPHPTHAAELVALVGLDLAAARLLDGSLDVPCDVDGVASSRLNLRIEPKGPTALGVSDGLLHLRPRGRVERALPLDDIAALGAIDDAYLRGDRPFRPVAGRWFLALHDDNPLAGVEAHPHKSGSHLDLGGQPPQRWIAALEDALELVDAASPLLRDEMAELLQGFVPVGYDAQRHVSASYREAVGLVYLSLHPQRLTMAEAIVHEFQHSKMNALLARDPLLENHPDESYPSPVRPDPRPLLGVLLAVHAFVAVAAVHRRLIEEHHRDASEPRFEEIVAKNRDGLSTLRRHARPTPLGRRLIEDLESAHAEASA